MCFRTSFKQRYVEEFLYLSHPSVLQANASIFSNYPNNFFSELKQFFIETYLIPAHKSCCQKSWKILCTKQFCFIETINDSTPNRTVTDRWVWLKWTNKKIVLEQNILSPYLKNGEIEIIEVSSRERDFRNCWIYLILIFTF